MILLLNTWEHNRHCVDPVDWAVVSLSVDTIDNYLDRIQEAQELRTISGASFSHIEYWDVGPVWIGPCEVWEDLYPEPVQIVEHLQAGEHGLPLHTECTNLTVTYEGVSWETSFKDSFGTAGTDLVTIAVLEQLRALVLQEEEQGRYRCQRNPERP